jgi:hypothetical protein
MTVYGESQKTVDAYLSALRRHLQLVSDEEANDIVAEIEAHIADKTAGDGTDTVPSTLAALGTPEELAGRYRTDGLLRRGQVTRSPVVSLRSLFRWASLSLVGLVVFLVSVVGYSVGGGLVVIAALKMIWPGNTGLWVEYGPDHSPKSAMMGFGSGSPQPHAGHDVLGWWLVPIGLIVGGGLLFLTFRFGTWSIRRFWRPRALGDR